MHIRGEDCDIACKDCYSVGSKINLIKQSLGRSC